MLDDLLLKVQHEVVQLTNLAGIGPCALLDVGVTALERCEESVTLLALLILTRDNTGWIEDTGNTDLEILTIVADWYTLASCLIGANLADGDAVDIESLRRNDGGCRHFIRGMS